MAPLLAGNGSRIMAVQLPLRVIRQLTTAFQSDTGVRKPAPQSRRRGKRDGGGGNSSGRVQSALAAVDLNLDKHTNTIAAALLDELQAASQTGDQQIVLIYSLVDNKPDIVML